MLSLNYVLLKLLKWWINFIHYTWSNPGFIQDIKDNQHLAQLWKPQWKWRLNDTLILHDDTPKCIVGQILRILFGMLVEEFKPQTLLEALNIVYVCFRVYLFWTHPCKNKGKVWFGSHIYPSLYKKLSDADIQHYEVCRIFLIWALMFYLLMRCAE